MISEIRDRIEYMRYGGKVYNLQINLAEGTEKNTLESKKNLRNIERFTGSFIVTEKGYLVGGYDNTLPKSNAKIIDDEISPPVNILYENGHICQIIKSFGNLKLIDTCRLIQRERELCFV